MIEAGERVLGFLGRGAERTAMGAGRTAMHGGRFLGGGSTAAMGLLLMGGLTAGIAAQFHNKNSYTRRSVLPTVMESATGDPQFIGKVAREEFSKRIRQTNGVPTPVDRRTSFNPSGNIVLGLYNLKN